MGTVRFRPDVGQEIDLSAHRPRSARSRVVAAGLVDAAACPHCGASKGAP